MNENKTNFTHAVININDNIQVVTKDKAFELKEYGAYVLLQQSKEECEIFEKKVKDWKSVL